MDMSYLQEIQWILGNNCWLTKALRIILITNMLFRNANASIDVSYNTKQTNILEIDKQTFECSSSFCQNIICQPIVQCVNGEKIPNGSLCGCCDKCVTYDSENQPCDEDFKRPIGGLPQKLCKIGLTCVKGNCEEISDSNLNHCESIMKERKSLRGEYDSLDIQYSKELWVPNCDEAGRFSAKQCKTKKCMCVDSDGTALFGQEERNLAQNMTCNCARYMKTLENSDLNRWMTRTQEHCTSTGDYKNLQCVDNLCYCTDSASGEVQGRMTTKQLMEFLPCYDSLEDGKQYESQCDQQLTRTRSLRYQFYRKNINIVGLDYEFCDLDGSFGPKQCLTDKCICTNRQGVGIKSYEVDRNAKEREFLMKCNCARDEYDREILHARYPKMMCEGNGNYKFLQCFGANDCYCVDEDGDIISEKFSQEKALKVNCLEMQKHLKITQI